MASQIDYEKEYISDSGKRWKPSGIRGLFPLEATPGMISMLAGKPNPETFPFQSISVTLKSPVTSNSDGSSVVPEVLTIADRDLDEALQYGPTSGINSFVSWIIGLQQLSHRRGDPKEEGSQELITEIPSDEYGIKDSDLHSILENWYTDEKTKSMKFPKVVYTCPTGSNPTGASASLPRKQSILALIRKFKLLIMEDDAYFYLHFDRPNRAPSYFELEKSDGGERGRVIRFDSLSWGYDGFIAHCDRVAAFYAHKLQVVEAAARKHLEGLADWDRPRAGMFLWFKLRIAKLGEEENACSKALIATTALRNGVLAVPGYEFMPSGRKTVYVRTSFSLIDEETADEGFRRLASAIKEARKEIGLDA
ncbi:pyridoxal phosphate-dependent transferase [Melampsora americana]|nr:pyridoxal phosphate-dependent transferase [Melampsora americana]